MAVNYDANFLIYEVGSPSTRTEYPKNCFAGIKMNFAILYPILKRVVAIRSIFSNKNYTILSIIL